MTAPTASTLTIQAILFDADGVLQRPAAYRTAAWQHMLRADHDVEEFIAALCEAESPALAGGSDFVAAVSDLVVRWQCQGGLQEVLRVWTMIEPDAAAQFLIDSGSQNLVRTVHHFGINLV